MARVAAKKGSDRPTWDGRGPDGRKVEPGIYLYQITSSVGSTHGKITVLH